MELTENQLARFVARIEKQDNGCWLWTGAKNPTGYGHLSINYQDWYAHRLAYALWVGELDPALELDHLCNVRLCVNPEHLQQVSHKDNIARRDSSYAGKALEGWRNRYHAMYARLVELGEQEFLDSL